MTKPAYGMNRTYYENQKVMKYTVLSCVGHVVRDDYLFRVYKVRCDCGREFNVPHVKLMRPILGCKHCL